MTTMQELLSQQAALNQKINELRQTERKAAIKEALELIAKFELTKEELFASKSSVKKAKAAGTSEAKYRDPISGVTWSGRGRTPQWIKDSGKDKKAFLIS